MKFIVASILWFCLALPPPTIQGEYEETINVLNSMAAKGGKINNVFEPSEKGFLGIGGHGFMYKGILNENNKIAMKFIPIQFNGEEEIKAYGILGAFNNEVKDIESYGVPKVHYNDTWKNFTLIGITSLDSEFALRLRDDRQVSRMIEDASDILILFREVVRISKYIHSRGICHGDLYLESIMFRDNQGLIIHYESFVKENIVCRKYDWRKFLKDISKLLGIKIDWTSNKNPSNKYKSIKHKGLKRVFLEFINTAYTEGSEMNYDYVYGIINEEITNHFNKRPVLVSWLTSTQRRKAKSIQIPPIDTIDFQ